MRIILTINLIGYIIMNFDHRINPEYGILEKNLATYYIEYTCNFIFVFEMVFTIIGVGFWGEDNTYTKDYLNIINIVSIISRYLIIINYASFIYLSNIEEEGEGIYLFFAVLRYTRIFQMI